MVINTILVINLDCLFHLVSSGSQNKLEKPNIFLKNH
jgi:hypothetical protein